MRVLVLVATVVGGVIGAAWLAPALIRISPWLAAGVVLVGIVVVAWWEARDREEEQTRAVMRRWRRPERRE